MDEKSMKDLWKKKEKKDEERKASEEQKWNAEQRHQQAGPSMGGAGHFSGSGWSTGAGQLPWQRTGGRQSSISAVEEGHGQGSMHQGQLSLTQKGLGGYVEEALGRPPSSAITRNLHEVIYKARGDVALNALLKQKEEEAKKAKEQEEEEAKKANEEYKLYMKKKGDEALNTLLEQNEEKAKKAEEKNGKGKKPQ